MSSRPGEAQLLAALDSHDRLVLQCARGELSWEAFERAYDGLYERYPLDGHESDVAEAALFAKHAGRIELHREIWDRILTSVTTDELARQPEARAAGLIDSAEAVCRLQALAAVYLVPGRCW